jgi:hypothetical protein
LYEKNINDSPGGLMSIKKLFYGVVGFIAAEVVCLAKSWYFLSITILILGILVATSQIAQSKKVPRSILR